MNCHRIGTIRKIEARLAAYDAAVKAGKTSAEAFEIARRVTRKQAKEAGR